MKTAMKRTLSVLLCVVILMGIAPLQGIAEIEWPEWRLPKLPSVASLFTTRAEAADATSGSCGTNATWNYDTETQTLTISGSGGISSYSSWLGGVGTTPWDAYKTTMKTLEIGNGITSIGSYDFYNFTGLENVTIPSSVTSIGLSAFYCTGLKQVNIDSFSAWCRISFGNSDANPLAHAHHLYLNGAEVTKADISTDVSVIGSNQFYGWSALRSVTIPNNVTSIGHGAFYQCTGLTSVMIPDSVTSIGDDAFYGCTGLTRITIPNSVTSINNYVFNNCTGLTSVTIPDSVTSIGSYAFSYCTGLTSVTIPDSVTSIGEYAFYAAGLASITLSDNLTAISANTFNGCKKLSSITIPDSVTSIGNNAFSGCSTLATVVIPDSVTIIGEKAFYQCPALKNVSIPDGVTKLDAYVFAECQTLPSISVPGSVTVMGNYIFQNCGNLTSVVFENGVTAIAPFTCSGCTGLKNITFADSVETIGDSAFYGCVGLKSLTLGKGIETIGSNAFQNCSGIRSLPVPSSVKTIGTSAFSGCTGLTGVTLNQGLEIINNGAFRGCIGLRTIDIPDGVTVMGDGAFYDCTGLRTITLPDSLTLIGQDAFYNTAYYNNNSNWTQNVLYIGNHLIRANTEISGDYEIRAGVKCIANNAFGGCGNLTGVVIPSGVTAIPGSAFSRCTRLITVTIPGSVTSIGSSAFSYCTGLTSVTIPDSVTNIGSSAFYNCTALTSIRLPAGLTVIPSYLFEYSGLKTVKIPRSVTTIYYEAFNCNLTTVYYTGSESEWNKISIGSYNTALNNATKYFESVLEDDTQQTGTVTYVSDGSHSCTLDLNLEAQWFAQDNKVYNHDLARFCANFAMLGYMKGRTDLLRNALTAMGFDGEHADINLNTGRDEVNYFIADQQIIVNGRKTRLVFAGLIGSNGDQWFSNFDPDATESSMYHKNAEKGDNHLGFIDARDYVHLKLSSYYTKNNIDKNSAKLLLTGHSRGAAAANLLAAELIDSGKFANANSIYTYTFATPRGTALEKADSPRYDSIFNIVNPEDFVTKVMLDSWGFKRYGKTITLPSKSNDKKYASYLTAMRVYFNKFTGNTYSPYLTGEAATYAIVKELGLVVRNLDGFYNLKLPVQVQNGLLLSPYDFFKRSLCPLVKNLSHMDSSEFKIAAAYTLSLVTDTLAVFYKTILAYFVNFSVNLDAVSVGSDFACAHQMETYCAYMMALSGSELNKPRKGLLNSVNCPVDVEVYNNETDELVGRIINNKVDETILSREDSVVMTVDGDSKQFWLPENGDYRVVLTGNDNGTMDYTVAEIDSDLGEVDRVNFFDVPVVKNAEMIGELPEDLSLKDYELQMPDETALAPTEQIEEPEAAQFTVTATADGNGVVTESLTATSGDYVTLTAVPNDGAGFAGWYENDALVSEDAAYGFVVKADCALTAKFEPLPTYQVIWTADGEAIDNAAFYAGAAITQPDPPTKEGYTFIGWTPAVPDVMPAEDLTFTAVFEPNVYTATVIADGEVIAEIPFTYGQKSIQLPDVPKKEGHGGVWPPYSLGAENITIEAVYAPIEYTVTYYADDQVIGSGAIPYGNSIWQPRTPQKEGYTFTGWTPAVPESMPANDLTFYAVFEPVTYYATFMADGKQVGEKIPYTVETAGITPPAVPEKAGYTGQWENYTLAVGGVTINAVYTKDETPPVVQPTIKIKNFTANKSVDYKTTITFTAVVTDAPAGAAVHWFIDGRDVGTGETYKKEQATASYTVQCKLMQGSTVLAESEVETVKVNTGFFAKLIAFFKGLFGSLPVITQAIKETL